MSVKSDKPNRPGECSCRKMTSRSAPLSARQLRIVRTFHKTGLPPEFGSNPQTRRVQLESEKWRSVCAAPVEDDLIVLPELLEKPTGVLGTTCSRSFPHDFLNGVRAVDCGEDPLQCRINRKG